MRRTPSGLAAAALLVSATAHAELITPLVTLRSVESRVVVPNVPGTLDSDEATTSGVGVFDEFVSASTIDSGLSLSAAARQRSEFQGDRVLFSGGGSLAENWLEFLEPETSFRSSGLMLFTLDETVTFTLTGVSVGAGVSLRLANSIDPPNFEFFAEPSESVNITGTLPAGTYGLEFEMAVGGDTDPRPDPRFSFSASYGFELVLVPSPASAAPLLGLLAFHRRR